MQTKTEVVICSSCEGRGYIVGTNLVDYHKGEFESFRTPCRTCDGTGRMLKKTTITYEKFVNEVRS